MIACTVQYNVMIGLVLAYISLCVI